MQKGKKVFEYVVVDKDTQIHTLSILDQIRVLLKKLLYNPEHELDIEGAYTESYLTLKADLLEVFYKATEPIRMGQHKKVRLQISSEFKPVIKEVISSPKLKRSYHIKVSYPNTDYDVKFFYQVDMEVREREPRH